MVLVLRYLVSVAIVGVVVMSEVLEYIEANYRKLEGQTRESVIDAFEAGQQSQQSKIDAITKQRDSFIKAHHIAMNDVCENKAKIDELQKLRSLDEMEINQLAQANQVWRTKCDELQARVDEALHTTDESCGVSVAAFVKLNRILKGNKDGRV